MKQIGESLHASGLLSAQHIERVLEKQREMKQMSGQHYLFGEVCVELEYLSHEELREFLQSHPQHSIRLGELLVLKRNLSSADLERVLKAQDSQKHRLGELLLQMQLISETELVEALSAQLSVPIMQPVLELMDTALLEGLDLKYCYTQGILPISATETTVTVIMNSPNDPESRRYLAEHFDKKLMVMIGPRSEMHNTLKAIHKERKSESRAIRMDDIDPYEGEDDPATSGVSGISLYSDGEAEDEPPLRFFGSLTVDDDGDHDGDDENESQDDAPLAEDASKQEKQKKVSPKAPPPEPEVKDDTLIVGGVSLSSSHSEYKQQEGMLNYLINSALQEQASNIHIEPQGAFIRVRYRINGVLHQKTSLPANLGNPMVARLKQITSLNPDSQNQPQRNRVQASYNDKEFELSIATYPSVFGEAMVLSLRQKQGANRAVLMNLEQAGFSPLNLWRFKKVLSKPGGLVIVTGPVRSGKTVTVYAALSALNLLTRSIATAESPIEQTLTGVTQGNWTPESGLSFPEMIQAMSYLDSDVLMVSEIDSPETLEATVELAQGGAKVITSYPSFDTMGALMRLNAQGLQSFLIASSNLTVVSQRLVRKICPHCKQEDYPHKDALNLLGLVQVEAEENKVAMPKGCEQCNQLGYLGQTAIHEVLVINDAIREAILDEQPAAKIRNLARTDGKLMSMAEDGYAKCVVGMTSLAEVQRVAFINEYDSQYARSGADIMKICKAQEQEYL